MAEKQLLADQIKLIERTRKAGQYHQAIAEECNQAGLPILCREHDHMRTLCEQAIGMQLRALKDGALGSESRGVLQSGTSHSDVKGRERVTDGNDEKSSSEKDGQIEGREKEVT